ncbi:MAG: hypothetical protein JXA72_07235 [Bacteroidales bacterium]|nr:hypothetical protein [Bacteroidales bacterium]
MKTRLYFLLILIFSNLVQLHAQDFQTWLKSYNASLNIRINRYDTARYNLLTDRVVQPLNQEGQSIEFLSSKWKIEPVITPTGAPGQFRIDLKFFCQEGILRDGSLSCDVVFDQWSTDNYVLMPGSVYNGNRYPVVKMKYMPFFNDPSQIGPDQQILLSDQPRLNYREGQSRIQQRSGAMSIPAIGYTDRQGKGFWLFSQQGNPLGDYGIGVEELKGRTRSVIFITSPVVREVRKYFISDMEARPSDDQPASFKAGDQVTMTFYIDFFESPNVQSLYDRMAAIRQAWYPTSEKANRLPFWSAFQIQEAKFNRENWNPAGYYRVGTFDNFSQDWQIGWVGGMMTTLPLLMEGSALSRERVLRNFDWLSEQGVSPTGYYYDIIYKGKAYGAFPMKALGDSLVLTRKNADAVYYIYKQFDLMKKMGIVVKPQWEMMNLNALEAQLTTWKNYGQLGQFVNQETGRLVIGNTTSAGIFPAALCAAYRYTGNREYLNYAEEIGTYYYQNFIREGLTCGGPGDAMQSFDSESSYGLLESMTELYETTGKKEWLQRSEEMARQFSSWVVAYDFKFPETSLFHRLDIRSNGAVYANTQNAHGGPGICTHSGLALLKLYRATGNPYYIQLLTDIAHALPQFMSTKENPWPGFNDGWISERCNLTDWLEGIGETFAYSSWSETALLLTISELPGVYVNLETEDVYALDHVKAHIVRSSARELVLEMVNETGYDARVKILAENPEAQQQPMYHNASLSWEQITVPAGSKKRIRLKR